MLCICNKVFQALFFPHLYQEDLNICTAKESPPMITDFVFNVNGGIPSVTLQGRRETPPISFTFFVRSKRLHRAYEDSAYQGVPAALAESADSS